MTYREILNRANRFMGSSGIREFCRTQCGGKCCEALIEFAEDKRCCENITCDLKLPCVLFICGRAEGFLQQVVGLHDPRWLELAEVEKKVNAAIGMRLETLKVSRPDAYKSSYFIDTVNDMDFEVDYPAFSDEECLCVRQAIAEAVISESGPHI